MKDKGCMQIERDGQEGKKTKEERRVAWRLRMRPPRSKMTQEREEATRHKLDANLSFSSPSLLSIPPPTPHIKRPARLSAPTTTSTSFSSFLPFFLFFLSILPSFLSIFFCSFCFCFFCGYDDGLMISLPLLLLLFFLQLA